MTIKTATKNKTKHIKTKPKISKRKRKPSHLKIRMPRIRTVKPELFNHEGLFDAEKTEQLPLRLAFIALFTCCDREGRFRWQPRHLKIHMLPYDDIDISRVLHALLTRGFIVKYECNGEFYGCIPSWLRHQNINNKEPVSFIPAPELPSPTTTEIPEQTLPENSNINNEITLAAAPVRDACVTRPRSCFSNSKGKGRERKGR